MTLDSLAEVFDFVKDEWLDCPLELLKEICNYMHHKDDVMYVSNSIGMRTYLDQAFVYVETDDPRSFKKYNIKIQEIWDDMFYSCGASNLPCGVTTDGKLLVWHSDSKLVETICCNRYMLFNSYEIIRIKDELTIVRNGYKSVFYLKKENRTINGMLVDNTDMKGYYSMITPPCKWQTVINEILDRNITHTMWYEWYVKDSRSEVI